MKGKGCSGTVVAIAGGLATADELATAGGRAAADGRATDLRDVVMNRAMLQIW